MGGLAVDLNDQQLKSHKSTIRNHMSMNSRIFALTAVSLAASLMPAAYAQQEYYALARFNKIWRIDDYGTNAPILTEFVTTPGDLGGGFGDMLGIEVDPGTGDIFVLLSNKSGLQHPNSYVIRYDINTAVPSLELVIAEPFLSGLARRWDGDWYSIHNDEELWLIDQETGSWTAEPLDTSLFEVLYNPLTIRPDGKVLMEFPSSGARLVDPISGETLESAPSTGVIPGTYAYDQDGSLHGASLHGELLRFDASSGEWNEYFDASMLTFYIFDVAFRYGPDGQGFNSLCEGLPNSTGQVGSLELLGSSVASGNQLELNTRGLPAEVFGFYVMSNQAGSLPVGDGVLCLGQPLFRYNSSPLLSSDEGTVRFPLDLNHLANGAAALPGDTYHFQLWHRDTSGGVGTSNLSTAISVTFE